jgi:osmotically-inducible protein OsmY
MRVAESRNRELRIALLLADGTGDFDFVRVFTIGETIYLDGYVKTPKHKVHAEEIAHYVGFEAIENFIRLMPETETDAKD